MQMKLFNRKKEKKIVISEITLSPEIQELVKANKELFNRSLADLEAFTLSIKKGEYKL